MRDKFKIARAKQLVSEYDDYHLRALIRQGLREITVLVTDKPDGWFEEVQACENVMRLCDEELKRRGIND